MEKQKRYSILMTEEDARKFRAIAKTEGMPMSVLLRQWVRREYKKSERAKA